MAAYDLLVHPEASVEFDTFVNASRSMAFDVGNHFRVLESFVADGPPNSARPAVRQQGCDVYMFYGGKLLMFIAVYGHSALLVQLSALGTEHEEASALSGALERAQRYFQL